MKRMGKEMNLSEANANDFDDGYGAGSSFSNWEILMAFEIEFYTIS